jgi:hypothetical protein
MPGNSSSAKALRIDPSPSSSRVTHSLKSETTSIILRRSSSEKSSQEILEANILRQTPYVRHALSLATGAGASESLVAQR